MKTDNNISFDLVQSIKSILTSGSVKIGNIYNKPASCDQLNWTKLKSSIYPIRSIITKDNPTSLQISLKIRDQKNKPNCTSVYTRLSNPLCDYKLNQ